MRRLNDPEAKRPKWEETLYENSDWYDQQYWGFER